MLEKFAIKQVDNGSHVVYNTFTQKCLITKKSKRKAKEVLKCVSAFYGSPPRFLYEERRT